ncbi:MAG: homoserine O-succinyltransferase [Candidatus Woesearchaeota archaeon]
MPINVRDGLPAVQQLQDENIFVMTDSRARHQDIRPLDIVVMNLMPEKEKTETHLLRRLANTALQLNVTFLHPETHTSKHTSKSHLDSFYSTFPQIRYNTFDGLIITGAPIEQLPFDAVTYWRELQDIMDWSLHNVTSTLHICWGAQAGLFHHYGIGKQQLDQKVSGIYKHTITETNKNLELVRGFDDIFFAPHSRHTTISRDDVLKNPSLDLVSESDGAGVYIVVSKDKKQVFVTGHSEYDTERLAFEYKRDRDKGLLVEVPYNYDLSNPKNVWRGHSNLLFNNWINYYVYQETPYDKRNIS